MSRPLDWDAVRRRYTGGRRVRPLVGESALRVSAEAEDAVRVHQRLWQAEVTRAELEVALRLLGDPGGDRQEDVVHGHAMPVRDSLAFSFRAARTRWASIRNRTGTSVLDLPSAAATASVMLANCCSSWTST
jgi:hypothetical protein